MKNNILFAILFFAPFLTFSQEKQEVVPPIDKILQIDKEPLPSQLKLPITGIGTGIISFHGDITNDEPANFTVGCNAVHLEMMQTLSPSLKIGIRYLRGELRGSTYYPEIHTFFDFKTEVNSFGAFVNYNFANIKDPFAKLPPVAWNFFVIRRIEVGQNYKGKKHPHLSYGQKEIYKDIVIDEPYVQVSE